MSYAAEPYAQFVDDLLFALTGGMTRQEFRFLPEQEPFRLTAPGAILPNTVQVFGQHDGAYLRFRQRVDYLVAADLTIEWREREDGTPAADALWPDEGTAFYANFEYRSEAGAAPQLTDRNPGSVVRLLAESFAREFAVLSRQLEAVYQSAFVGTATGRDLDQLALLVGIVRRRTTFAGGSVVFGRSVPSPADIFIPSGTRLTTAEPPALTFETLEDATLRRGNMSAEVPIQALSPGSTGIVPATAIRVINRPILGIDFAENPQATSFSETAENDDALRVRVRRALEGAGLATNGALISALTSLPGLREKDIAISEDPLASPGVVKLTVALPEMDEATRQTTVERAIELIEETRPVGVRILHNIDAPRPLGLAVPGPGGVPDEGDALVSVGEVDDPAVLFLPVDVIAQLAPSTLTLTPQQRADLQRHGEDTVRSFIADAGIGETLVYNRLIAQLMAIEGVIDVSLELFPQEHPEQPHFKNLVPSNPAVRPVAGVITIEIGGALVMLDVAVSIKLKGPGEVGDTGTALANARDQIESQLRLGLQNRAFSTLTPAELLTLLAGSDSYDVLSLHYNVEYQEAGARIKQQDAQLPITGLEQLWARKVSVEGV